MAVNMWQQRRTEAEWMDRPDIPAHQLREALYDITWVNRWLGGYQSLIAAVSTLIERKPEQNRYSILDLGTGLGDIPMALIHWGDQRGIVFHVTAVDNHPVVADEARQYTRFCPEVTIRQADALNLGEPDNAFDLVTASMFLHHLPAEKIPSMLGEMARLGRLGFVVNDLYRHPVAWLGIKALGRLMNKGPVFQHDAALSVMKGFRKDELAAFARQAGLHHSAIEYRNPYRVVMTYRKYDDHDASP